MNARSLALIALSFAILFVLWQMLLPGYILTLDMAFTPHMPLRWSADALNNSAPFWALISLATTIMPGWLVEKALMLALACALFSLPYRFLPLLENRVARMFGAAVYALNPFVYTRFLAGQWLLLAGYALLPVLCFWIIRLVREPTLGNALRYGTVLAILAVFSAHLAYLASIGTTLAFFWLLARAAAWDLARAAGATALCFLVLGSYWIVPALVRPAPLEARFDAAHYAAFAAAPNARVPVLLNVAALGGYWGEGTAWRYYFRWPQGTIAFWIAFGALALLVLWGAFLAFCEQRPHAIGLILAGILAYVTALGASATPLRDVNLFLYMHMPMWEGLRDSQKIVAFLAFGYAAFSGYAAERLINLHAATRMRELATAVLFAIPACLGLFMWGGFHGQLRPVWYPASWAAARAAVQSLPQGERVLLIPWHGYFSLAFDHDLIVSNPGERYFGSAVLAGRSVEAGAVHDQEVDPAYRALDTLLATSTTPAAATLAHELSRQHIDYLLVIRNAKNIQSDWWPDAYALAASTTFDGIPLEEKLAGDIFLYRFATEKMKSE